MSEKGRLDKKSSADNLKKRLTDLQWHVTQEGGTESAFTGQYLNEGREGAYRCICCSHLLFTSEMKYASHCGWPSFHTEDVSAEISRIEDKTHGLIRTEVRCSHCDSHLGHLFPDGPLEHGGLRYCINSASLEFEEGRRLT